jgi:lipid A 3-O-deacylase
VDSHEGIGSHMRYLFIITCIIGLAKGWSGEDKPLAPSHLMVGPGLFDVDRNHPRALIQTEYRWEVNCHHIRPLVAFFITTDQNFFICGGVGYDIFIGKKIVFTPSFAPGLYYSGYGKHLGFPLNFRSAAELAYVFHNQGRFGAQFNHISNAHILWKNPGANSLIVFYAIPFPQKKRIK